MFDGILPLLDGRTFLFILRAMQGVRDITLDFEIRGTASVIVR